MAMPTACDLTPTPLLKERGFKFVFLPSPLGEGPGVRSQEHEASV